HIPVLGNAVIPVAPPDDKSLVQELFFDPEATASGIAQLGSEFQEVGGTEGFGKPLQQQHFGIGFFLHLLLVRQAVENVGVVAKQRPNDADGGLEILLPDHDLVGQAAAHISQAAEDHHEAKTDQPHAPDRGQEPVLDQGDIPPLDDTEVMKEIFHLRLRQYHLRLGLLAEVFVQNQVFLPQIHKILQQFPPPVVSESVLPIRIHFQVVNEEPTEQAILGTGDQAMYLPGGA